MANSSSVKAITLTDLDTATLAGGYVSLNPNGLEEACFKIIIINASNIELAISYDGSTAHDLVRPTSERVLDFQSNAGPNGQVALMKKGQIISVGSAVGAGKGFVTLVGYYQDKN